MKITEKLEKLNLRQLATPLIGITMMFSTAGTGFAVEVELEGQILHDEPTHFEWVSDSVTPVPLQLSYVFICYLPTFNDYGSEVEVRVTAYGGSDPSVTIEVGLAGGGIDSAGAIYLGEHSQEVNIQYQGESLSQFTIDYDGWDWINGTMTIGAVRVSATKFPPAAPPVDIGFVENVEIWEMVEQGLEGDLQYELEWHGYTAHDAGQVIEDTADFQQWVDDNYGVYRLYPVLATSRHYVTR